MASLELRHLPADVLGLDPWACDVLAQRPTPRSLPGMIVPGRLDEIPPYELRPDVDERKELAENLLDHLGPFQPHVAVLDSIRSIVDQDAAVVIAGQQPGFLGGPLYDIYKAVSAIKLAKELSKAWSKPVVPVFWNHADDHDIAEVHHLWIQNTNLDLRKVSLAGVSSGRTPFWDIRFDEERSRLGAIEELLRQSVLPDVTSADGGEATPGDAALASYLPRHGESFSNAFTRVLLDLFGEHGLIVVEPPWIRESLSRALAKVVASDVMAGLREGTEALRAAGSDHAIDPETAALVFHLEDGKRRALRAAGDEFRFDGEAGSRTGSELAAEIIQEPEAWSAGALLRPLAQDLALPVVAYVGGWGELRYHAQLPPLRARAGVPRTMFVPRLSATVVDPAARTSLERLDVTIDEALRARGHLGQEDDGEEGQSEASRALRLAAAEAKARLSRERETLAEVDRGLAQQLKKAADQMHTQVEKIAGKVERVQANSRGGTGRHLRRVNNAVFPRESPQERVHGSLPFVARHGRAWIDELVREIDPLPTEHVILYLGDPT